jgi:hypothetical protein
MASVLLTWFSAEDAKCRGLWPGDSAVIEMDPRKGGQYEMQSLSGHYTRRQDLHYSILNAFIGEIDAARFAGIIAATNEHTTKAAVATVNAGGSHQRTP